MTLMLSCLTFVIHLIASFGLKCHAHLVNKQDQLFMANVEALVPEESTSDRRVYPCVKRIKFDANCGENYTERYCGDCKEVIVTKTWGSDDCYL